MEGGREGEEERRGSSKQSEVTRGSRVSSAAHHLLPKKHDGPKATKHRKWRHEELWEKGRGLRGWGGDAHKVTDGKEFGNTCDDCIMHVLGSAEGRV